VTQRGNNRQRIFFDDDDYLFMLALIRQSTVKTGLRYDGYCLMPNHFHFITIPPTEQALSAGMKYLELCYSLRMKERYGFIGHLWQGRFGSCPMDGEHYTHALHYVECNPPRAHLVRCAWEYPWSSAHAHVVGHDPYGVLDLENWLRLYTATEWMDWLGYPEEPAFIETLRRHTTTGIRLRTWKK
jgi:putative transposase